MKTRKILSCVLSLTLMGVLLPCSGISAVETDWKSLYEDVLLEYMETTDSYERSRFSLNDINRDEIPELIISEDSTHAAQCLIYTIYNNKLFYLGKYGAYGSIGYYSDLDVIIQYNIDQGYEFESFSRLENGEIKLLCSFENNIGAAPTDNDVYYKVNKENVTEEEYNSALDKYRGEEFNGSLGWEYEFTEYSINNAINGYSDWRDIYRNTLYEFKKSETYSKHSRFDIYDINGDNIPELFILPGTDNVSEVASELEVYTVSNGELADMGTLGEPEAHNQNFYFYPDTDILLASTWFYDEETGSRAQYRFMKMENNIIMETYFIESVWDMELQQNLYTFNGKESSYDEYCHYRFAGSCIDIGSKYSFGNTAIEYALRADDILTNTHKAAYIYKLFQLKAGFGREGYDYEPINDAQFELCDLNGDGYAELAFSPSISFAGGACSIFTAGHGGRLIEYGQLGFYGNFNYNTENCLVYTLYGRMGANYGNFYRLNSKEWEKVISFSKSDEEFVDERVSMGLEDEYHYELNGENVTQEQYYSTVEEYENEENSVTCGRRIPLTSGDIAEAFFGSSSTLNKIKTVFYAVNGYQYSIETGENYG